MIDKLDPKLTSQPFSTPAAQRDLVNIPTNSIAVIPDRTRDYQFLNLLRGSH